MMGIAAATLPPVCFSTMRRLASEGQPIRGCAPVALRDSGDVLPLPETDCADAVVDCAASSIATQTRLSGMSTHLGKQ